MKRLTSRLYYRVFDTLGDVRIEPGSANYLLMDRIVVDAINELQDQELFLRGVVRWFGYSLTTIQYRPGARKHGATKYSLRRSLELAVTGIASHSIRPLRAAIWLSLSFAVVGGLLVIYSIVSFLFVQHTVAGWTSIMAAIAILGAVQLLVLGIIGEYVGRILRETAPAPALRHRRDRGGPGRPERGGSQRSLTFFIASRANKPLDPFGKTVAWLPSENCSRPRNVGPNVRNLVGPRLLAAHDRQPGAGRGLDDVDDVPDRIRDS